MFKGVLVGFISSFLMLVVLLFGGFIVCRLAILTHERGLIEEPYEAPAAQVIMVFGASVLNNTEPSHILTDRLETAFTLYQASKGEIILLSGDNGNHDYDEVTVMRDYLLNKGVPSDDLFLDHAGFDTYDSLYRAKYIFGAKSLLLVTQRFHLPRAMYIASGLDLAATGVVADRRSYSKIKYFVWREWLASVKAVLDVMLKSKPTYLGQPISLEQSGKVTWDDVLNIE